MFAFSLYDVTTGTLVFAGTSVKGGGSANPNQETVTCSTTLQDTLGSFAGPGQPLPGTPTPAPPSTTTEPEATSTDTACFLTAHVAGV